MELERKGDNGVRPANAYRRCRRDVVGDRGSTTTSRSSSISTSERDTLDEPKKHRLRGSRRSGGIKRRVVLLSMGAAVPSAFAQSCISLSGSTTCSAFSAASVSTSSTVVGLFPFLQGVADTASFDRQLTSWVQTSYVGLKYGNLLGCGAIDLTNTTSYYARFTTTTICNAVVQNSRDICGLSTAQSKPLCAESCAQFAESEATVLASISSCPKSNSNAEQQIRADFTNCALPANSLSGSCIAAISNEPSNCGFASNVVGLCSYCSSGGVNSTDTCCYNSKAESRCVGVVLPSITASISLTTSTVTATATASATAAPVAAASSGLSGGAIAGIVIGSIAALALLVGLIILLLLCLRRRRDSHHGTVFNQPTPPRKSEQGMSYHPSSQPAAPAGYEVLPGGRIARMSALEGHSGDSPPRGDLIAGGAAAGAAAGYAAGRHRQHDQSSSDEFRESPESELRAGVLRPPPAARRTGSLSSGSALGEDPNSPHSGSGGDMSSPQGVASQQSEQLPFFKDYYSQDEIHPGDKVATLWAYQPRAADEFLLDRGDMLKVVGIWDDGWATGVMLDEKAEDWDAKRNAQRDSGVSNGSARRESPPASGEIKAFPLVCVCLPEHWRKTIEGDGSTESGASGQQFTTMA